MELDWEGQGVPSGHRVLMGTSLSLFHTRFVGIDKYLIIDSGSANCVVVVGNFSSSAETTYSFDSAG
jgi:hypothetical protein